jgi:hypothetical protein
MKELRCELMLCQSLELAVIDEMYMAEDPWLLLSRWSGRDKIRLAIEGIARWRSLLLAKQGEEQRDEGIDIKPVYTIELKD